MATHLVSIRHSTIQSLEEQKSPFPLDGYECFGWPIKCSAISFPPKFPIFTKDLLLWIRAPYHSESLNAQASPPIHVLVDQELPMLHFNHIERGVFQTVECSHEFSGQYGKIGALCFLKAREL